mgnify:CR=1 FL=1
MRRLARGVVFGLALGLAACGAGAPPAGVGEREVANALRLARADFDRHRYAQAADGYDRALALARRLDDPARLARIGSERALALLRAGEAEAALARARELRAELARREVPAPPLAGLVEAAAALALGRLDVAEATLDRLDAAADPDPLVRERARYLRGRLAAAQSDASALRAVLAGWPEPGSARLAADRAELAARLALLEGRPRSALTGFAALAKERRALDELAAVGEALALAGEAAMALGEAARAADLHLRAARNALALERPELAAARLGAARRAADRGDEAAIRAAIERFATRLDEA